MHACNPRTPESRHVHAQLFTLWRMNKRLFLTALPFKQQTISLTQTDIGASIHAYRTCRTGHTCTPDVLMCCGVQTYTLWRMNKRLFLTALPFKLINDAATFVGPTFLSLLLGVVASGGSALRGYTLAGLMLAGLLIGTLADNQHFQRVMRAGAESNRELAFSFLVLRRRPCMPSCVRTLAAVLSHVPGQARAWQGDVWDLWLRISASSAACAQVTVWP